MGRQIEQYIKAREVRLELNRLRALDNLIKTVFFQHSYRVAGIEDKKVADEAIATKNYDALHKWVKERRSGCLEGQNLRELRQIARVNRLSNYSRLSKVELIRKIQQVTDQHLYTGEHEQ